MRFTLHNFFLFQSSPSFYAGCNRPSSIDRVICCICFNPHPAFMLGATKNNAVCVRYSSCFNPHPAFMLGATAMTDWRDFFEIRFQSSPSFYAGCNFSGRPPYLMELVSILTQLLCWVQPVFLRYKRLCRNCFNPHPAFMLGATAFFKF